MRLAERPYQRAAIYGDENHPGIYKALREHRTTLLVLPTGAGKSIVFSQVIEACVSRGKRVLVLAHREELIEGAHQKLIWSTSVDRMQIGIEMAGERAGDHHAVVLASVQTLQGERLRRIDASEFGLVVIDECFPASVKVGGRNIADLRAGDHVPSWDEPSCSVVSRRVTRAMSRRADRLIRLVFDNSETVVCTPNHPFLTVDGWTPAALLSGASVVYCAYEISSYSDLHQLWKTGPDCDESSMGHVESERNSLLYSCVPRRKAAEDFLRDDGAHEQKILFREDDREQSNAPRGRPEEDGGNLARHGPQTDDKGGQRVRPYGPAAPAGRGVGLGDRSNYSNRAEGQGWPPDTLQVGHRESRDEDCGRGGRSLALAASEKGPGQAQGRLPSFRRVDRIEILEQGRDGTFGGLCPDGKVYNLEVEQTHTYLVDGGYVAHNCHHSRSKSYEAILNHFPESKILGVTATPDRLDGKGLGKVFASVAYVYEIADAVRDGYLVRIMGEEIRGGDAIDLSDVRTTAGDLNQGDLAAVLEKDPAVALVARGTVDRAGDRPTIIFAVSVAQARAIAEYINAYLGRSAAVALDGTAPREIRREVKARFERGEFQFLCNCALYTEGVDIPSVACVSIARPTQSRALYSQMVGRGLRLLGATIEESVAAGKEDCKVLDFSGVSGKHKLVTCFDVLDGNTDEEVRRRVIKRAEAEPVDALEQLELVSREIVEEQRLRALRDVKYRAVAMADPFTVLGVHPRAGRYGGRPATVDQVERLARHKIPGSEEQLRRMLAGQAAEREPIDYGQAEQLLRAIAKRVQQGKCSVRMAKILVKHGLSPDAPFAVAKWALDQIAGNRWKPTPEVLAHPDLQVKVAEP